MYMVQILQYFNEYAIWTTVNTICVNPHYYLMHSNGLLNWTEIAINENVNSYTFLSGLRNFTATYLWAPETVIQFPVVKSVNHGNVILGIFGHILNNRRVVRVLGWNNAINCSRSVTVRHLLPGR